jgi:hypothetical protein
MSLWTLTVFLIEHSLSQGLQSMVRTIPLLFSNSHGPSLPEPISRGPIVTYTSSVDFQ